MSPNFLMAFSLMNRIESFTRRIDETPEQGIPGIGESRAVHLQLAPLGDITPPDIGTPMKISAIKKREFRRFRRLLKIGIRGIMAT